MGKILIDIYDIVTARAGFQGRMRLAVRTGVPRVKAQEIEDLPEIVDKFKQEASEILRTDIGPLLPGLLAVWILASDPRPWRIAAVGFAVVVGSALGIVERLLFRRGAPRTRRCCSCSSSTRCSSGWCSRPCPRRTSRRRMPWGWCRTSSPRAEG